jgi:cobalt-zinc-cadmium efflux system protein
MADQHAEHGHAHGDHGHGGHGHAGHGHDDGHGHSHVHAPASFDRAFAIGISANIVFVAAEAFFGWKVNSLALLADAGHNLGDVAGLVMAWGGALAGKLRPDVRYTYGWKRASILAAFANALLLLVAMGSLAWEALQRLQSPQPIQGITVMVVAGIGIAVNLGTALLFMRGRNDDINIRGAYLHMASDALVSAGVVIVGAVALWTGWGWLDPVASLAIAFVIVVGTWGMFRQSLRLMFDGVPEHIDLVAVRGALEALPGVDHVHDLHVWATGTSDVALTAHLVMPCGHPDDPFFETATLQLRDRFKIGHVTLQVVREPFMTLCGGAAGSTGKQDADDRRGPGHEPHEHAPGAHRHGPEHDNEHEHDHEHGHAHPH